MQILMMKRVLYGRLIIINCFYSCCCYSRILSFDEPYFFYCTAPMTPILSYVGWVWDDCKRVAIKITYTGITMHNLLSVHNELKWFNTNKPAMTLVRLKGEYVNVHASNIRI